MKNIIYKFIPAICVILFPLMAASQTSFKPDKFTPNISKNAKLFLQNGVWRAQSCNNDNFQKFKLNSVSPTVEVGAGIIGEGEDLEIMQASKINNIIEIKTRVCAPIGCNHTYEQYKIINKNQMQEWVFQGLLPNQTPNIVVENGIDKDGIKGRIFHRCEK